jgi:16S rRNA G966 N2-methylase RsmD
MNTQRMSRLFPKKDGVDFNNLLIDKEALTYITKPSDSEKITAFICDIMCRFNKQPQDITIVDATACAGGDTITFCNKFRIVIPIEENTMRYNHLFNNLSVYNIKNAYPILGDSLLMIPQIQKSIDVAFIDPPWGGVSYKKHEKLELTFGGHDLDVAVKMLFDKKKEINLIVLKLPKNYDYDSFENKLGNKYEIIINKSLEKIDILGVTKA